jgi:hypothetical protein
MPGARIFAIQVASFTFRNGELVKVDSRYAPTICANAVYERYPELEQSYEAPPSHAHRGAGAEELFHAIASSPA